MTQRSSANNEKEAANAAGPSQRPAGSAAPSLAPSLVNELIAGTSGVSLEQYVAQLSDSRDATSQQAAKLLEDLAVAKPELLAPHIEALVTLLGSARPRVAQTAAHVLPVLARVTPAKVAKQLKTMQASFPDASEVAKDGLVRTFIALCVASVTYQKRLIESFELALRTADAKQLPSWVEHILPALKGEPYAQARAVAEARVQDPALQRPVAERVAGILGIKLRPQPSK
jgi:hypothetical protein